MSERSRILGTKPMFVVLADCPECGEQHEVFVDPEALP